MKNCGWLILVLMLFVGCSSEASNMNEAESNSDFYKEEFSGKPDIMPTGTPAIIDEEGLPEVNPTQKPGNDTENKGNVAGNGTLRDEEMEIVKVNTEHVFEEYTDRETGETLVDMNYHVVSLTEGNEELKQSVSRWMVKRRQDFEERGLELMVDIKKKQEEQNNKDLTASLWHEVTICRADSRMVSLMDREYFYCADEWGTDYQCVNFDVKSGKRIILSNLLVDEKGFKNAVGEYCLDKVNQMNKKYKVDETFIDEIYKIIAKNQSWYLNASGFTFIYEDDEMKYSNEGVIFINVPYEVVEKYIKPEYIWGDIYGVASLGDNETATIVVDGVENQVCVEMIYDEYSTEHVRVIYGDSVIEVGEYLRTEDIYLLNHKGWKYLVMDADWASDDYVTYFYRLENGKIGEHFYMEGDIDCSNITNESFRMRLYVDVLGTYMSYPEYFITENGKVATYDKDLKIEHYGYDHYELVTERALPVMKGSEKIYLPKGSRLSMISTDEKTWAKLFWIDKMEEVVVNFERRNYVIYIDGLEDQEYFKTLPYSG